MVDDRDKEPSKGQERPSRPVTAAARRERRASARPAAGKESSAEDTKAARSGAKSAEDKAKPKAKAKSDSDAKPAAKTAQKGEHKGRPTPTRDRGKDARPGLFARLFRFLREVVAELRKVIWPTRKQMITYTAVVLVFVAFMVALIAGLDLALAQGVTALFG
ncbi:preprotein translocase subunit SecE [Actinophytocola glycyrrhizae]|uniref:Protein translocase subunit SecE n=1 Tax=Actinophytocola glycyrrhizae TaxID=2044873 RepID=A0ABV9RWU6_9PSEU